MKLNDKRDLLKGLSREELSKVKSKENKWFDQSKP